MSANLTHDGHPVWTLPQRDVEQVPMFLDAGDIIDRVEEGEWFSVDVDSGMDYESKLDEAQDEGLYDDIAENGVIRPVVLRIVGRDVYTGNGHHRTAVAADLGQLVPVIWTTGYDVWADDSYSDPERTYPVPIGAYA